MNEPTRRDSIFARLHEFALRDIDLFWENVVKGVIIPALTGVFILVAAFTLVWGVGDIVLSFAESKRLSVEAQRLQVEQQRQRTTLQPATPSATPHSTDPYSFTCPATTKPVCAPAGGQP